MSEVPPQSDEELIREVQDLLRELPGHGKSHVSQKIAEASGSVQGTATTAAQAGRAALREAFKLPAPGSSA